MICSLNIPYTDTSVTRMPSLQIYILKDRGKNHFNCHKNTPYLKEKSSELFTPFRNVISPIRHNNILYAFVIRLVLNLIVYIKILILNSSKFLFQFLVRPILYASVTYSPKPES